MTQKKQKFFSLKAGLAILAGLLLLFGACDNPGGPGTDKPDPPGEKANLLIWQVGAGRNGAISHSFVEIYNPTNKDIGLKGYTVWYSGNGTPADWKWDKVDLKGIIPAYSSFLILGQPGAAGDMGEPNVPGVPGSAARLVLATYPGYNPSKPLDMPFLQKNYQPSYDTIGGKSFAADMYRPEMRISNNQFKVVLTFGVSQMNYANPFDMTGDGTTKNAIPGYIDMVGAINPDPTANPPIYIDGFEGKANSGYSQQKSVCRVFVEDTDNNSDDFKNMDYRQTGLSDNQVLSYRPKGTQYGAWTPPSHSSGSEKLMILQMGRIGNRNGLDATPTAAPTGGGFPVTLIELYNNTNSPINLSGYYLHIGSNVAWTNVFPLSGTIPSKCSFLITSSNFAEVNATPRASLPAPDISFDFTTVPNQIKVAILKYPTLLTVNNPFADASLTDVYVDMIGAGTGVTGYETASASISAPQPPRRISLTDTDNNSVDFKQADYRGRIPTVSGMGDAQLYKYWPRNKAAGPWNPITGENY
ncbi:MAG: lamin tail domain-containing protein [Treponema sp.]|nr:lamin tail domain-containing protein [Treponema sp.]